MRRVLQANSVLHIALDAIAANWKIPSRFWQALLKQRRQFTCPLIAPNPLFPE